MVVPTMLSRIVDAIDAGAAPPATLRSLSYGGSKISPRVLERALELFPDPGVVNAYGLTETASTVAVLGPDDHRAAVSTQDASARRRLSSAGRIVPSVEAEVRGDDGIAVGAGEVGILYVRGEQIAGEYATGSVLDGDGWFCTRDRASIDDEGYLFIEGRADDTIIRGGENIAPSEIEEVLCLHPAIAEACVVGIPDEEWGQRLAAVVVASAEVSADELRSFVRERLRGSKTPETITFRDALPHTPTGKLLRRVVQSELAEPGVAS
jgi:acyl-CoA synthetase (AMP-forming)/AMP-acid ligase II